MPCPFGNALTMLGHNTQRNRILLESIEELWTWPAGIALPRGGDAY